MPESTIEFLLPDGDGAARIDGGTVHIPGTLPGDVVRWTEASRRGRTVHGTLDALLSPSADRVTSPCPWSADCGGCDLDMLAPVARHAALAGFAQRAFRWPEAPRLIAGASEGYRARISLGLDAGRVGYRAPRSHALVEPDTCAIARPELAQALLQLRSWAAEHGTDGLSHCELRTDGERVIYAFTSTSSVPRAVRDALPALGDVALDGRRVSGEPTLHLKVRGCSMRVGPSSFYQVNIDANHQLVDLVLDTLHRLRAEAMVDLYAGLGNFTLPMARELGPVTAVEREGQASADLTHNAKLNDLSHRVTVVKRAAERFDPSRVAFDVAVLDPPRSGAKGVVQKLVRNRPRAIIYVSCNVAAAARDLAEATREGYRLTELTAFDLFPRTRHVEAVVVAER